MNDSCGMSWVASLGDKVAALSLKKTPTCSWCGDPAELLVGATGLCMSCWEWSLCDRADQGWIDTPQVSR